MHLNKIHKCPICKNVLDIFHTGRDGFSQVFGIAPRQGFGVLGALQNPGSTPKP